MMLGSQCSPCCASCAQSLVFRLDTSVQTDQWFGRNHEDLFFRVPLSVDFLFSPPRQCRYFVDYYWHSSGFNAFSGGIELPETRMRAQLNIGPGGVDLGVVSASGDLIASFVGDFESSFFFQGYAKFGNFEIWTEQGFAISEHVAKFVRQPLPPGSALLAPWSNEPCRGAPCVGGQPIFFKMPSLPAGFENFPWFDEMRVDFDYPGNYQLSNTAAGQTYTTVWSNLNVRYGFATNGSYPVGVRVGVFFFGGGQTRKMTTQLPTQQITNLNYATNNSTQRPDFRAGIIGSRDDPEMFGPVFIGRTQPFIDALADVQEVGQIGVYSPTDANPLP